MSPSDQPTVLVLRAPGTNCDRETVAAFAAAGAAPISLHVNGLLRDPGRLAAARLLCIPGGFSFGDDIAAGRVFAERLRQLADMLHRFVDDGGLVLGVCNGFQVLVKTGLLFTADELAAGLPATLAWNDGGRFDDRWVRLAVEGDRSPFLQGLDQLYLPIAHAEGRFSVADPALLERWSSEGRLALRYADDDNPNGAEADVAGMCDATGRVFGLMPHPERFLHRRRHPFWTRLPAGGDEGDGLAIFRNAVAACRAGVAAS